MLRHRPHASNVAVVPLLPNKNGGGTLILKKKKMLYALILRDIIRYLRL
jgi:hypothetical protein